MYSNYRRAYRGMIVHADAKNAILGRHEPLTEGAEASTYVLIEQQHLTHAALYDNLDKFKLACHQNNYCRCNDFYDSMNPCLAAGKVPYTGPTFTSEELCSVPYFDLYRDLDDLALYSTIKPVEFLPVYSEYIWDVHHALQENPALVERCVDAIRVAGDRYAHSARKQIVNQKYVGKRFLHFNTYQYVVDHLEVLEYNADNGGYICLVLKADLSGTGRTSWVEGHEARSACDGHAQDKLEQIGAAIQHLCKSDGVSDICL